MEEQRLELDGEHKLEETQFIVTKIGNEQYGIDIKYINNIVRMQKITRVPKAPYYYKGVINLRGEVIPVMSLRRKFELEDIPENKDFRIIIIKTDKSNSVGVIVDSVSEVVSLDEDHMEKTTVDGNDSRMQYIAMLGKYGDTLISIVNVENLIMEKD